MQKLSISSIQTPIGKMHAGATGNGLCFLEFENEERLKKHISYFSSNFEIKEDPINQIILQTQSELTSYFNKTLKVFTIPLDLAGTEFQVSVWKALLTIPFGQTRSYLEQSKILGDVKAIRAVATANGKNKIAIIVPCHRVIGSDGSLTGYAGELWRKKKLLDLESNQRSLF